MRSEHIDGGPTDSSLSALHLLRAEPYVAFGTHQSAPRYVHKILVTTQLSFVHRVESVNTHLPAVSYSKQGWHGICIAKGRNWNPGPTVDGTVRKSLTTSYIKLANRDVAMWWIAIVLGLWIAISIVVAWIIGRVVSKADREAARARSRCPDEKPERSEWGT